MKGFALLISTFWAFAALAADPRLARTPSDLALAATSGSHRLLVFQVCSPEHCWNDFFVQELSRDPSLKVVCSTPISEFNGSSDVIVKSVHRPEGSLSTLELELFSSHDAFQPYTATLMLENGCKYRLQPAAPAAANNSFKPKPLRGSA